MLFVCVCLSVCLSVCLLATLCKNFGIDLHGISREGWQWASEQMVTFWWQSRSRIRIQIRIATLVRRALAEVCTVLVLLVIITKHFHYCASSRLQSIAMYVCSSLYSLAYLILFRLFI